MTASPEPAAPPAPTIGPWAALLRMLFSPGDVFPLIRARSPWFPPYLLLGLTAAATATMSMLNLSELMAGQLAAAPELAEMGDLDALGGALTTVMAVAGGGFALFTPALSGLILALVLYVFGLMTDNRAGFGQLFSLAGYAELPNLFAMLAGLGLVGLAPARAAGFDLTFAVLWPGAPLAAAAVLGMLSPFSVWKWTLVALGLRHVGQLSPRQAWWLTAAVFAAAALTRVALSSMSSALAGLAPTLPG